MPILLSQLRLPLMRRKSLYRYGLAIMSVGLAFGIRRYLENYSKEIFPPFTFFYPAVMFSAWYGGLGPGLLATGLGAVLGYCIFLPQYISFLPSGAGDFLQFILFLFISLTINLLTEN